MKREILEADLEYLLTHSMDRTATESPHILSTHEKHVVHTIRQLWEHGPRRRPRGLDLSSQVPHGLLQGPQAASIQMRTWRWEEGGEGSGAWGVKGGDKGDQ